MQAHGVLPKMTRVDLVFNYGNFVRRMLRASRDTVMRHKIKTIVILVGFYVAHKTFGVYKSFKNALNPLAGLQEIGAEEEEKKEAAWQSQETQSQAQVKQYLKADGMHLLQLKVF